MIDPIYDRLVRAVGDEGLATMQSTLVTIVTDGPEGLYFALPFASSGMPVRIIGNTLGSVSFLDLDTGIFPISRSIAEIIQAVFPRSRLNAVEGRLSGFGSGSMVNDSRIIIDCTNDPGSKSIGLDYLKKKGGCMVSSSVLSGYARLSLSIDGIAQSDDVYMEGMQSIQDEFHAGMSRRRQVLASATRQMIAQFMGGIAAEEAIRWILGKNALERSLHYKFGHGADMFTELDGPMKIIDDRLQGKAALLFGAGAVGSSCAFPLAALIHHLDVMDYDLTESSNYLRAPMLFGSEGEQKSMVASRRLSRRGIKSVPQDRKMVPGFVAETAYDLLVDGFDNFPSRYLAFLYAAGHKIPLISGSGRFNGWDMEVYIPGKTKCFDCSFGLAKLAEKEEARIRESCGREIAPQNSWMNQSLGALIALTTPSIFYPRSFGMPFNGMAFYNPELSGRLYIQNSDDVCKEVEGVTKHVR